jgi:hypothetical protein
LEIVLFILSNNFLGVEKHHVFGEKILSTLGDELELLDQTPFRHCVKVVQTHSLLDHQRIRLQDESSGIA